MLNSKNAPRAVMLYGFLIMSVYLCGVWLHAHMHVKSGVGQPKQRGRTFTANIKAALIFLLLSLKISSTSCSSADPLMLIAHQSLHGNQSWLTLLINVIYQLFLMLSRFFFLKLRQLWRVSDTASHFLRCSFGYLFSSISSRGEHERAFSLRYV